MAVIKEFMGSALMEKSGFPSPSTTRLLVLPLTRKKVQVRAARVQSTTPVSAITEHLSLVKMAPEKAAVNFKVKAVITVRHKIKVDLKQALSRHLKNVVLELISTDLDPETNALKKSAEAVMKKSGLEKSGTVDYLAEFVVDSDFGIPGAVMVVNNHHQEFFLDYITIEGFAGGPVHFPCCSWVQSSKDYPGKRIFFSNQPYLPDETPSGLKALRVKELRELRGDGKGTRKLSDRVYEYDVYNDLGNPDKGIEFSRPTLGGAEVPYPRRCQTGRPAMITDPSCESRVEKPRRMYVPRDEQFEDSKRNAFSNGRLRGVLRNLIPTFKAKISDNNKDFKGFIDIDSLYYQGLLQKLGLQDRAPKIPLPKALSKLQGGLLKFDIPKIITKDKYAWLRDDEFARQVIAGVNPVSIERLRAFPPMSKLDPQIYGPKESALRQEHLAGQLNGLTVQEAMDADKLYIIDYHDIYLPFLDKMNALDGRKSYATRTIFFLTEAGTLKPIAIELSLPPAYPGLKTQRVVTPPVDATSYWMWQLAKAHVCSNDCGVHQLVNHWLRTHAALEPFILSAHRQMSSMHPIFKLLDPHMRYTLEINAFARQSLISVDGVIESCFTPGRYCMEISAAAYKNFWRFDQDGLPADLIRRGMAIPDATQPHGLRLVMQDYPYAADGLMIWSALQNWIRHYVNHYYPNSSRIQQDTELQAWYAESINVGHADLREAPWWPTLATPADLASILTTLIWQASGQHAALNFGQYPYSGYVPNRTPLVRRLIPNIDDPEYKAFITDPERYFVSALPSLLQTTRYMAAVDILSTHSPDEEYLGERQHRSFWSGDAEVVEAFNEFSAEMKWIEKEIDRRNKDPRLRNRYGAGVMAYELLSPSSEAGMTCRGVPNSVTI